MDKPKKSGYILLISALIISAILFTVVFAAAVGSFYLSSGWADMLSRQQSFFLAWSCLQMGRLRIIQNPQAPQTGEVTVGPGSCQLSAINLNVPTEGQITIRSSAQSNGAVCNLQMVINSADLTLISWADLDSS